MRWVQTTQPQFLYLDEIMSMFWPIESNASKCKNVWSEMMQKDIFDVVFDIKRGEAACGVRYRSGDGHHVRQRCSTVSMWQR